MSEPIRTALVTGAGSPTGIGFASAKRLAEAGYRVAITSTTERIMDRAQELSALGHKVIGVSADLMHPGEAQSLLSQTGPIDVLVNNAGMASLGTLDKTAALEDMTDEEWAAAIDRNLTTAFRMTRAVIPHMKAQAWGRIVNVASTSGAVVGVANDAAYSAAKAGMMGMTRSLCLEVARHVARHGVTVNAVAPGWIASGSQTQAEAHAGAFTPVGRSGLPDEVAACIAFLCSQGASYITGHLLVVDGGNSVLERKHYE